MKNRAVALLPSCVITTIVLACDSRPMPPEERTDGLLCDERAVPQPSLRTWLLQR